jgi:hypothetical protein
MMGTNCYLDVQVKELCSKVNRINTLNEAIKAYFSGPEGKKALSSNT